MASKNKRKRKKHRSRLEKSQDRLRLLYEKIPGTKGCMENISDGEGCHAWCCALQNPQTLTCEFFYVWEHIHRKWSYGEIIDLVEASLKAYLSNMFNKSCIFWDRETKFCRIHTRRPFNCRIYGITPNEEIQPRVEKMRAMHSNDPMKQVRDQCNLVSTESGDPITVDMTKSWWEELLEIEQSLGIKSRDITDSTGGSYRTYHDQLLIRLMKPEVMSHLSSLRMYGAPDEKALFIHKFIKSMKDNVKNKVGVLSRV